MKARKTATLAGRRPAIGECLEAWWRICDVPAGRILPDVPRGIPTDRARLCDAFDLYCWQLVARAFDLCRNRSIPATRLARLVAHRQCGGRFADFKVYDLVQHDEDDASGFRSKPRPVSDVDRVGLDEEWIAKAAYVRFKKVLQRVIDEADAYLPPARR